MVGIPKESLPNVVEFLFPFSGRMDIIVENWYPTLPNITRESPMKIGDLVKVHPNYGFAWLYEDNGFAVEKNGQVHRGTIMTVLGTEIMRLTNHYKVLLPDGRVYYVQTSKVTKV